MLRVPVAGAVVQFENGDDEDYIEEARRPYQSRMTLKDLRKRNVADKAAAGGQPSSVGLSVVDGPLCDPGCHSRLCPTGRPGPARRPEEEEGPPAAQSAGPF